MLALLAALVMGGPGAVPESPRDLAKLAIAQGAIEGVPAGGASVPLKSGDGIDPGTLIKTPAGARATVDFPDGCELRISENTEVSVEGPRKIDLKKGRIFVKILKAGPSFEIKTEHIPITSDQSLVDVEYFPRIPNGEPAHTFVRVIDGVVKATSPKFKTNIFAGFYATGLGSQLNTPDPLGNASLLTSWIHPLLVERGRTDDETGSRAMDLVQVLGREAANDPAELALRSLGDLATSELVRFLTKHANGPQPSRRVAAVKIIAETGTMKSAAGLATLLQNPEADTRVVAARGLARLAGKDLGFGDPYWKGDSLEKGQKAWEDWVKANAK